MIGFTDPSLKLHLVTINTTHTYKQYSAITDLHTFQFTAAHALGFSVSTSRILATDLNTNYHFKSLWSLLVISSSITLECWPYSPILILQPTWFLTLFCQSQFSHLISTQLHTCSCDIDAARTCIRENTSHDRYPLLCDTAHVRKLQACRTATVCMQTQRKHFHRIVWGVCWNMFTGPLPSNALSESVTILSVFFDAGPLLASLTCNQFTTIPMRQSKYNGLYTSGTL
jgi:hypothetical protein